MSIEILREIISDADPFGYIAKGVCSDCYDDACYYIADFISKDLSIEQLCGVVWWALYELSCVATCHLTNSPLILTPEEGMLIVGDPKRFNSIAHSIRHQILSI